MKQLFSGRPKPNRFQLNGDRGEVIPLVDQNLHHGTLRFHLILQAIRLAALHNSSVAARASERVHYYEDVLAEQYRLSQKSGRSGIPLFSRDAFEKDFTCYYIQSLLKF